MNLLQLFIGNSKSFSGDNSTLNVKRATCSECFESLEIITHQTCSVYDKQCARQYNALRGAPQTGKSFYEARRSWRNEEKNTGNGLLVKILIRLHLGCTES